MSTPHRLTFLIDTNIFLTLEPFGPVSETEPYEEAATFQRRVHEHGHRLALHSGTRLDIERDRTKPAASKTCRRSASTWCSTRRSQASPALVQAFGASANDQVDALIGSALDANAAHYIVTEDRGLRQRLARVAPTLGSRALSLAETIELLDQLYPPAPEPPPLVQLRPCYSISLSDPIFDSIRAEYDDFDKWFKTTASLASERR